MTLEDVLDRLEGAVRRLADQSAPLERMVADWEQAQALVRDAERRLEEIEGGLRREAEAADSRGGNGPAA
ncbi:MAG: exodeoxyribonuclease VII small subunit [Candidatus Dormibacteraeota bacterium]|nr:exodeoxyribonuclease VII small subunit [Candidatus Dormibacteraeota bacterium]MBO0744781.1 exodeoxyribonuclease VII small subunit [Candidatus Dormibacteraeota bacterium]